MGAGEFAHTRREQKWRTGRHVRILFQVTEIFKVELEVTKISSEQQTEKLSRDSSTRGIHKAERGRENNSKKHRNAGY